MRQTSSSLSEEPLDLCNPKEYNHFSYKTAAFFLLIPLILNYLFCHASFQTAEGLTNSDWLGFWGGYIGNFLGILVTFQVFHFTYKQNERQNRQNRELSERQYQQNQEYMREDKRLSLLPVLLCTYEHCMYLDNNITSTLLFFNPDSDGRKITAIKGSAPQSQLITLASEIRCTRVELFSILFENIGREAMIETALYFEGHRMLLSSIPKDRANPYIFAFPVSEEYSNFSLEVVFYDLEHRAYKQCLEYRFSSSTLEYSVHQDFYPIQISPPNTAQA